VPPETKPEVLPAYDFSTPAAIFIISVESTANEYIIYTVKNAMNFPFGNQEAAEKWQDIPCPVEAESR
jgi:hypothetical protein